MTRRSFQRFLVYLSEEECYGVVSSFGAFASLVKYIKDGIDYEIFIANEDLIFLDEISIGIQEEEL